MKDLTVKWKNIKYSYQHGLECLAKVATKELIKELPLNKPIEINGAYIDGGCVTGIVNTDSGLKINKIMNMLHFECDWDKLSSEDKLEIYFKIFNKLIKS